LLLDRELEKAKIDLIDTCADFNLYDAFRLIDKDAKGYVTSYDLRDALDDPRALDMP
jgi:Ca2+-binding EF-hand superfamily protein